MRVQFWPPRRTALASQAMGRVFCLLLVWAWIPYGAQASIPHPHHQPRQVVHIIERLERRWQQAELDANTAILASMLSDDYLGISANGTLSTKPETLESFKSGAIHFTAMNSSDRKIRVYGSTAVVVSRAQVSGTQDGEDISGHYRYTRVYHRTNGVWKIVSFEASRIHPKQSGHPKQTQK